MAMIIPLRLLVSPKLALEREGVEWCYWHIALIITSRDVEWLASLSRADAAALVSLDSVAR